MKRASMKWRTLLVLFAALMCANSQALATPLAVTHALESDTQQSDGTRNVLFTLHCSVPSGESLTNISMTYLGNVLMPTELPPTVILQEVTELEPRTTSFSFNTATIMEPVEMQQVPLVWDVSATLSDGTSVQFMLQSLSDLVLH